MQARQARNHLPIETETVKVRMNRKHGRLIIERLHGELNWSWSPRIYLFDSMKWVLAVDTLWIIPRSSEVEWMAECGQMRTTNAKKVV
jgi:hypothetical protein